MKKGVIITIYNKEMRIDKNLIIQFLKQQQKFHLCFVNNGCKGKTLSILQELAQLYPKFISVVNIKNEKDNNQALRIGFRFVLNITGFNQLLLAPNFDFKELKNLTELNKPLK